MGAAIHNAGRKIELYQYRPEPGGAFAAGWKDWSPEVFSHCPAAGQEEVEEETLKNAPLGAEFEKRLAEEVRAAYESGRERGRQEGRLAEREAQAKILAETEERRKQQVAGVMEDFARQQDRYLHDVEQEVVSLALAVAARILRRESQMDPLLLTGAVRVALGQLAASTKVRMHVPETEIELWTEAMATLPNLTVRPEVVRGEGMHTGDCLIETNLGSVDLGIRGQLGEIERGFFDRAGDRRSSTRPAAAATETGL
jgi:flagellar assembly protein FliH